jgi:glucose 1-dehydrogenase
MPGTLDGKVALVTGASSGIGRAAALALAEAGADVALNYLSAPADAESAADAIRTRFGRRALLFPLDISDQPAVERMADAVARELGGIHLFVSSAAYSDREPFLTADMANFRRTVEVSLWGAFNGLRACGRHMVAQKQGGAAVIVSSPHAQIAFPHCMAYNIAKAGLDMMMKTAATELLPHGIRVNAVYPGWTDTPGERKFFDEATIREAAKGLPMGRMATAEEIAAGIRFLCEPASAYMTGSVLHLDGGLFLPWWSKRGEGTL